MAPVPKITAKGAGDGALLSTAGQIFNFIETAGAIETGEVNQATRYILGALAGETKSENARMVVRIPVTKRMILDKVEQIVGSRSLAERWYNEYVMPGFGRTPSDLVASGLADAVLMHVDRLHEGVYA